jgi:hypothetical protein
MRQSIAGLTEDQLEEQTSRLMDAEGLRKAEMNESKIMHRRTINEHIISISDQKEQQLNVTRKVLCQPLPEPVNLYTNESDGTLFDLALSSMRLEESVNTNVSLVDQTKDLFPYHNTF